MTNIHHQIWSYIIMKSTNTQLFGMHVKCVDFFFRSPSSVARYYVSAFAGWVIVRNLTIDTMWVSIFGGPFFCSLLIGPFLIPADVNVVFHLLHLLELRLVDNIEYDYVLWQYGRQFSCFFFVCVLKKYILIIMKWYSPMPN